jgi:hypothetical protein
LPAAVSTLRHLHVQVLVGVYVASELPAWAFNAADPASPALVGGLVLSATASALWHLLLLVLMGVRVSLGLSALAFISADSAPQLPRAGGRAGFAGGAVQLPGLPI